MHTFKCGVSNHTVVRLSICVYSFVPNFFFGSTFCYCYCHVLFFLRVFYTMPYFQFDIFETYFSWSFHPLLLFFFQLHFRFNFDIADIVPNLLFDIIPSIFVSISFSVHKVSSQSFPGSVSSSALTTVTDVSSQTINPEPQIFFSLYNFYTKPPLVSLSILKLTHGPAIETKLRV